MNAALDEVYKAIEGAMPPEALVEIAPGELERVAMAALDASASETWKARAERLADMHRDMCVVAGTFQSEAERLSSLSLVMRSALEAIDGEVLLAGHLKTLVDEALAPQAVQS